MYHKVKKNQRKNITNNCKVRNRNNETPKNCVYIVGILGCEEDDMNQKKSSLGETQILFFFFFTLLLGKK